VDGAEVYRRRKRNRVSYRRVIPDHGLAGAVDVADVVAGVVVDSIHPQHPWIQSLLQPPQEPKVKLCVGDKKA